MARQNRLRLIYFFLAPLALVRRFRRRRPAWVKPGAKP
jgi:hypothetical protein